MTEVPDQLRALLVGPNVAVLGSIRPDGRPQQFVVWAAMAEDNTVLMSTTDDRPKYRNLAYDPHVSLVVYPAGDPYNSVHVRGTVTFGTEGAAELIGRERIAKVGITFYERAILPELKKRPKLG